MTLPNFSRQGSLYTFPNKVLFVNGENGIRHYFAFGLSPKGIDEDFYPESLLDDWGHEITGLNLFTWIQKNGSDFPRAELFGFSGNGNSRQYFLRELELWSKYPCLVSSNPIKKPTDGKKLDIVVLLDDKCKSTRQIESIPNIDFPFNKANVSWWETAGTIAPELLKTIAFEGT